MIKSAFSARRLAAETTGRMFRRDVAGDFPVPEQARDTQPSIGFRTASERARQGDSEPRDETAPYPIGRAVWDGRTVLAILDLVLMAGLLIGFFFVAVNGRVDFMVSAEAPFIASTALLANLGLLYASGAYRREALVNSNFTFSRLPVAVVLAGLLLFCALHYGFYAIFPKDYVYRSIGRSAIISLISMGIALGATLVARGIFHTLVQYGFFSRRVLVIGNGPRAQFLNEAISHSSHRLANRLVFAPASVIGAPANNAVALSGAEMVHDTQTLDSISKRLLPDEIVVALDDSSGVSLDILLTCKTRGIRVTDMESFLERETGRVDLGSLQSSWLVWSDSFGLRRLDATIKRVLDVLLSLTLLFVAFPILFIAMAALAVEGHGRVFFRQKRVTLNGNTFWLYKLRSMYVDAEKRGPRWAAKNDPRVTPVGQILRKCRIDEIPQLLNVLRGDMSLVGPRPERPVFVAQLSREIPLYDLRHTVKAGLTGWAQINYHYGASTADAKRKLEYDLHYVKNYTLIKDLSIIAQTFRVLLWREGGR